MDKAEQLANDAQKAESIWSMHLWGDSPTKLLADIQVKRSKLAREAALAKAKQQTSGKPADSTKVASAATPPASTAKTAAPAANTSSAANLDAARGLLKQGRKALQDHDLARARELAREAAQKKPDLEWWEDTPDRLLADIRQAEGKAGTKTAEKAEAPDPRACSSKLETSMRPAISTRRASWPRRPMPPRRRIGACSRIHPTSCWLPSRRRG